MTRTLFQKRYRNWHRKEKQLQTVLSVLFLFASMGKSCLFEYKYVVSLAIVVVSWMNIVQNAVCMSSVRLWCLYRTLSFNNATLHPPPRTHIPAFIWQINKLLLLQKWFPFLPAHNMSHMRENWLAKLLIVCKCRSWVNFRANYFIQYCLCLSILSNSIWFHPFQFYALWSILSILPANLINFDKFSFTTIRKPFVIPFFRN